MPLLACLQQTTSEYNEERAKNNDKELEGLASLEYHERLTHFIRGSTRRSVKGKKAPITVIDFRPLFAVIVHHFQKQLAEEIGLVSLRTLSKEQLDRIGRLLKQYTNTLRDFEFIHANRWHTYFLKDIAASRIDDGPGSRLHRALIQELKLALPEPSNAIFSDADILGSFEPSLMQRSPTTSKTRGSQREENEATQKRHEAIRMAWRRFGFATLGGLAIVGPVLGMVANTAPARNLSIASVSILLFSIFAALFSSSPPESLLTATAAYAAVLVVFIGNQGGNH